MKAEYVDPKGAFFRMPVPIKEQLMIVIGVGDRICAAALLERKHLMDCGFADNHPLCTQLDQIAAGYSASRNFHQDQLNTLIMKEQDASVRS